MPTYSYGIRLTDARAAEIIRKAFPRGFKRLLVRKKCWMSVHTVCDALLHARIKCASESIEKCIEWAYAQK
jgi:hypothetical protein